MTALNEKALEAAARKLHGQQELEYDFEANAPIFEKQAAEIIRAYMAALDPAPGWMPIETAPFRKIVDLWCIYGGEHEATYPTGAVIGQLVPRRHKTEEWGWFGNQSKDGIPQGYNPDLIPVAWRETTPDCPADLITPHLSPRQAGGHHGA